jgi:hypothetical protein
MCGRYRLSRRKQLVEEYFDSASEETDWSPRYNIAPTQPVPVIRTELEGAPSGIVIHALGSRCRGKELIRWCEQQCLETIKTEFSYSHAAVVAFASVSIVIFK